MPTEIEDSPLSRRVRVRRSRAGSFAAGGAADSTRLESYRGTEAEPDEVDDAIEPSTIQNQIAARGRIIAPRIVPDSNQMDDAPNPRSRLNEVAQAGSSTYSREYRLNLLHRLLMRRVPLDQIAAQLQVSISTVEKDRAELKRRLREQARELDINEIIGGQSELYDEISGMALRMASDNNTPQPMRLAAMRTTLAANADRTRFLTSAGVFDALKFRRNDENESKSDIARLMERTAEMMATLQDIPTAPPRMRRSKPEGFAPFSMDDSDASNSTDENVEL